MYLITGYYLNIGKLLFLLTVQPFILLNSPTVSNSFNSFGFSTYKIIEPKNSDTVSIPLGNLLVL